MKEAGFAITCTVYILQIHIIKMSKNFHYIKLQKKAYINLQQKPCTKKPATGP